MKQLIQQMRNALRAKSLSAQQPVMMQCNYGNDYYGDKVCVLKPIDA